MAEIFERALDVDPPNLDIDPYDDAFIADPYPGYAAWRATGAETASTMRQQEGEKICGRFWDKRG